MNKRKILTLILCLVIGTSTISFASTSNPIDAFKKQISQLKSNIKILQTIISQKNQDILKLRNQLNESENTIASLNQQLTLKDNSISTLEKQVSDQSKIINDYKSKIVVDPFNARFLFDTVEKPATYTESNISVPTSFLYQGVIYAPIKFITSNIGKPSQYDSKTKTVFVGSIAEGQYMVDVVGKPYFNTGGYSIYKENSDVMKMGGKEYPKGYRLDEGTLSFNLSNNYKSISGILGLVDGNNHNNTQLEVYGDNKLIARYTLTAGSLPISFNVDVSGVLKLDFVKTTGYWSSLMNIANVLIK